MSNNHHTKQFETGYLFPIFQQCSPQISNSQEKYDN